MDLSFHVFFALSVSNIKDATAAANIVWCLILTIEVKLGLPQNVIFIPPQTNSTTKQRATARFHFCLTPAVDGEAFKPIPLSRERSLHSSYDLANQVADASCLTCTAYSGDDGDAVCRPQPGAQHALSALPAGDPPL